MELLKNSKGKWCAVFSVFLLMLMFTTPISTTSEGAVCTDLKEQHDPLETGC